MRMPVETFSSKVAGGAAVMLSFEAVRVVALVMEHGRGGGDRSMRVESFVFAMVEMVPALEEMMEACPNCNVAESTGKRSSIRIT